MEVVVLFVVDVDYFHNVYCWVDFVYDVDQRAEIHKVVSLEDSYVGVCTVCRPLHNGSTVPV